MSCGDSFVPQNTPSKSPWDSTIAERSVLATWVDEDAVQVCMCCLSQKFGILDLGLDFDLVSSGMPSNK